MRYGRSLEEDLSRRDFTINAMAARLPGYELVDPFGGLDALRERVLRTPGRPEDSFGDDPLRIMRAARFAAKLGFTVAPEVRAAMTEQAARLRIVSPERDRRRADQADARARTPRGASTSWFRPAPPTRCCPRCPGCGWRPTSITATRTSTSTASPCWARPSSWSRATALDGDLTVRLAALLHDIGKPKTRSLLPDGRVEFHLHEVVGAKLARRRLTSLRFPNDVVRDVSQLVELHLRFHGYGEGEWTDSAVRRYVRDAGPLLTRLHVLTRADCTTRNRARALRLARAYDGLEQRIAELSAQEELASIRPELDGNDIMAILGLAPGPLVGRAYDFLLELRMARGPIGREQATQELLRWAAAEGIAPAAGRRPGPGRGS